MSYVPLDSVRVLKGRDLLKGYLKDTAAFEKGEKGRYFCSQCGSSMFIKMTFGGVHMVGLFHGTFEDPKLVESPAWNPFSESARHYNQDQQLCSFLREALKNVPQPQI